MNVLHQGAVKGHRARRGDYRITKHEPSKVVIIAGETSDFFLHDPPPELLQSTVFCNLGFI